MNCGPRPRSTADSPCFMMAAFYDGCVSAGKEGVPTCGRGREEAQPGAQTCPVVPRALQTGPREGAVQRAPARESERRNSSPGSARLLRGPRPDASPQRASSSSAAHTLLRRGTISCPISGSARGRMKKTHLTGNNRQQCGSRSQLWGSHLTGHGAKAKRFLSIISFQLRPPPITKQGGGKPSRCGGVWTPDSDLGRGA